MPFSLYLQQSAISTAQVRQYASTAQLFDMVKWTKEAYNHFGVPYFDVCCQTEPFNLDPFIPFLISSQAGNNITVSTFDNKLWAPQVSGMVYATGTTNYIAKFQGSTSLINSTLFEYITASGTTMIVNGTTSQKVAMQDDGVSANLLFPNFTTSNVSGYSAIASQVVDGTRNRRIAQFLNDTLSLWGHSVIYTSGTIPTYGIWQGVNRTFSIAPTGNVIIRTSNTTSDFTDTGYKLDVFGSLRTNSTVNFTGIASTTTANTLYYNSSTGAVTYGAAPSAGSGSSTYYIADSGTTYNSSSTPVPISSTTNGTPGSFSFTPIAGKSYTLKATIITYDSGNIDSLTAPGIKITTGSTSQFTNHDIEVIGQAMNSGYEFLHYLNSDAFTPTYSTNALVSGSTGYGNNVAKTTIELNLYNCTVVGGPVYINLGVKNTTEGSTIGVINGSMTLTQLN